MSSKNGSIKISQKLAEIFDNMEYINNCHKNISEVVKEQFELIQRELNPDNNAEIDRELRFHTAAFLRDLGNEYEKKD